MVKVVFCDLDGTLLTTKKEILDENIEAIKRTRESGIEVYICSGRHINDVRPYREKAGAGKYTISINGTEISDEETQDVLFDCALDEDFCIKAYEYALENKLFFRIDTKYARYINIERYIIKREIIFDEPDYKKFFRENKVLQMTLGSRNSEDINKVENLYKDDPRIRIANRFMSGMLPDSVDMIEFINPSASKGNAIIGLCKFLRIDPKDAVAFGDDNNDISMLEAVGRGIAMGNALNSVKEVANEVIENNNEAGIAKVLNEIVDKQTKKEE